MNQPLPSPELRARVLDAVHREAVRSRPAGLRRRARAVAFGFTVPLAILALSYFGGPPAHERPHGYVAALALAWLPIAVVATWAGVGQGGSMLGRPLRALSVATLTPVGLLLTWAAAASVWPFTLSDPSGPPQHIVCNVMTVVFAVGPLAAFAVLRRRSDPVNPRITGAAIAAASAAWAALMLHLLCGFTSAEHILLGHIAPVLLVTLFGALWTARTVAIRARTG